jgi:ATP-binding cassette, subfamily B, multidrug efflux pump
MAIQEEEVLGKAYDARLMRRLLTYLHSYRWQVSVALVAIVLKAGADVLGPYLTKVAIDKYLARHTEAHSLLDRFLSPRPLTGIAQIAPCTSACCCSAFCWSSPRPTSCSGPARR